MQSRSVAKRETVLRSLIPFLTAPGPALLLRQKHIDLCRLMILKMIGSQSDKAMTVVHLCLHSLDVLGAIDGDLQSKLEGFVLAHQLPEGGFTKVASLPMPSLQGTFSALVTAIMLGKREVLAAIDRPKLYALLLRSKDPVTKAFRNEFDANDDLQNVYCALAIAKLTNMLSGPLLEGVESYILSCQTYEGGLGASPGAEAHGAFTYLGVASAALAGCLHRLNCHALLRWCAMRQMAPECGFNGRPNKVVDSCYSFWIGAAIALLGSSMPEACDHHDPVRGDWLYDQQALQHFLLSAAQDKKGLFADKPTVPADPFHTCYSLSALSVAQHNRAHKTVGADPSNEVRSVSPLYCVTIDKLSAAQSYFADLIPLPNPA